MVGYSFRATPSATDTSVGSGDTGVVRYRIEGYDIQHLMGKVLTLSFWVRQTQTGTHCISLVCGGNDLSYVMEYTINASDTWEFKEFTFTMADGSSGTWDYTNGNGLSIFWTLAAGSNFQTTKDAWQSGNYRATSSVQNFFNSTSNLFMMKQVQLELGSKATDFEFRHFSEELAMCQRYYEKSFDYDVAPAQNAGNTGAARTVQVIGASTGTYYQVRYSVQKNATPTTITFYNPAAANAQARNTSIAADCSSTTTIGSSHTGFVISFTTAAGSAAGNSNLVHWTADAEL
jgi:hypothetical protein